MAWLWPSRDSYYDPRIDEILDHVHAIVRAQSVLQQEIRAMSDTLAAELHLGYVRW